MNQKAALTDIYHRLLETYGPQGWWPAETPFEVVLGAVLTQNTAWRNAEAALACLKEAVPLDPQRILDLDEGTLQERIRPSGYYRQKARRLKVFCRYLLDTCDGDMSVLAAKPADYIRDELLELHGIGPETADTILLYALGKPVFVVDDYTVRLMDRLGILPDGPGYYHVQGMFTGPLEPDPAMFNEYHALIVRHSKETCRKNRTFCRQCRLSDMCRHAAAA